MPPRRTIPPSVDALVRRADRPSLIPLPGEDPSWDEIMKVVGEEAPRVGPKIITEGPVIHAIQRKYTQQIVHHLMVC